MDIACSPIGVIESCFAGKFGTPRQSGLVPMAEATVRFLPAFRSKESVRGLEGFSHIWLIFYFHESAEQGWHPTVRPPRLGGNKRVGVFASRSPFRPNPFGLSLVELMGIDYDVEEAPLLRVRGVDIIDGTPLLDVKPYVAFADSRPEAISGYAQVAPVPLVVKIPNSLKEKYSSDFLALLCQTIAGDPRPAYQREDSRLYGMSLQGYNITWRYEEDVVYIVSIAI